MARALRPVLRLLPRACGPWAFVGLGVLPPS